MKSVRPDLAMQLNGHAREVEQAVKAADGYISPEKLAAAVDLEPQVVRSYLNARVDLVRRADVTDRNGKPLFAHANAPVTMLERWGRLYSYITKEPLPSMMP